MKETLNRIWQNFSPREKILIGVMGIVAIVVIMSIWGFYTYLKVSTLQTQNQENDVLLETIIEKASEIKANAGKNTTLSQNEKRYTPPESLGSLLARCSEKSGVTIPESQPQPDEIIGKSWTRHSTEIRLRKQPLSSLLDFMAQIENNKRSFPVAITKFEIRKRFAESDSYDVTMVISTYELNTDKTKTTGGPVNTVKTVTKS